MLTDSDRFVLRTREEGQSQFPGLPMQSFAMHDVAYAATGVYNKGDAGRFRAGVAPEHPFVIVDTRPDAPVPATKTLIRPEPPPRKTPGRAIWELIVADMQARDAQGRAKYGTPLQANNGRNAKVDAYQEALDLVAYIRQLIEEGRALYPTPQHAVEMAALWWTQSSGAEPDQAPDGWNFLGAEVQQRVINDSLAVLTKLAESTGNHGVSGLRNDDDLIVALRNVGVDLACPACASTFYTGSSEHGHTCAKAANVIVELSSGLTLAAAIADPRFCEKQQWIHAAVPFHESGAMIRVGSSGRLEWQWCDEPDERWESIEWTLEVARSPCEFVEPPDSSRDGE